MSFGLQRRGKAMKRFHLALAALTVIGSIVTATGIRAEAQDIRYQGYVPGYDYGMAPGYSYAYAPNYNYAYVRPYYRYAGLYNYRYARPYVYGYTPAYNYRYARPYGYGPAPVYYNYAPSGY